MRIDSDELYSVDDEELDRFWQSGTALGALYAPLFTNDSVVIWNERANSLPRAPIFLNLSAASVPSILEALWLIRPEAEKDERVKPAPVHKIPLGTFYHLSAFRLAENAYRRSRFYCLVSMRMSGRAGFGLNTKFSSDSELVEIISGLESSSVDAAFRYHRIACGFPELQGEQRLREFRIEREDLREKTSSIYHSMLRSQWKKTKTIIGNEFPVFTGRSYFLDVTSSYREGAQSFYIRTNISCSRSLKFHLDYGTHRAAVLGCPDGKLIFSNRQDEKPLRIIAEFSIKVAGIASADVSLEAC